ncbi:MAG: S1 RNA-binding domain-containing protein [Solobacterium sp.]|nr:S1 RNA-binding domain-containing protein [Solobacterium sp.]
MDYTTGQITEGRITGIQPYGAFVALDSNVTGLIHISEISDGFVRDIRRYVHLNDIVRVKVLEYDALTHQAKLSLKALHKTHTRYRKRLGPHKCTMPDGTIGFRSIEAALPQWIEEASKTLLEQ